MLHSFAALLPADAVGIVHDGLERLPHFNPDDDRDVVPDSVVALRAAVAGAQAVFFSTPEYAGTLPGAFKNLLEWTIGDAGLYGKPVGWANPSARGATATYDALRSVLGYAGAQIVDDACIAIPVLREQIGADGLIADEAVRKALSAAAHALLARIAARR